MHETLTELLLRIEQTPIAAEFAPRAYTVDWGTSRGRGKRYGRGGARLVGGAMADPPRGVRTYYQQVPNEPDDVRAEVGMLEAYLRPIYLQARSAGVPHGAAMCIAWAKADSTITAEDLYQALSADGVALQPATSSPG